MAFETLLAEFKEPKKPSGSKKPYVLFGRMINVTRGSGPDMKEGLEERLFCLDCSGSHAQWPVVFHYIQKDWKVLKYWFPTGEAAKEYDGKFEFGKNPFVPLEYNLQSYLNSNGEALKAALEERDALKRKVAEFEATEIENGRKGNKK